MASTKRKAPKPAMRSMLFQVWSRSTTSRGMSHTGNKNT